MENIPENSLMGNIKHNTSSIFNKARNWAAAQYEAVIDRIDSLATDNNPEAHRELLKMADEHSIPHDTETTKEELVERIKSYFNQRHSLAG